MKAIPVPINRLNSSSLALPLSVIAARIVSNEWTAPARGFPPDIIILPAKIPINSDTSTCLVIKHSIIAINEELLTKYHIP